MKDKPINFLYSDFEPIKAIALTYPGAKESTSYGTPSIKVNGKFMCRLHNDGEFIPIRLDFALRDEYLANYPDIFHLPDHYKSYPAICMWVNTCPKKLLQEIVALSWKGLATRKQIAEWEKVNKEIQ